MIFYQGWYYLAELLLLVDGGMSLDPKNPSRYTKLRLCISERRQPPCIH